ncbi:hypothetical protein Cgig2_016132 [Carnegiea gigantea]|uniref:Pentatricopeptide repeat-containing protein n=1 Tax=Carnegiea gigantea TaxID=171969 RepID=A0A9Q1KQG2_9CARY|nr:hypothetical protein Cgig2_016132 [Carnegiea gigantea]
MTICPLASITEIRAPPSNSHQTRPVICRKTYPNENHPRNFTRVEPHSITTKPKLEPCSIQTRPTLLQPVDLHQTQLLELIKKPYETRKLSEALYFLQCIVSRGYPPDVFVCTKLIRAFFDAKDVEKAIEVMNILESKGKPNLFAYNAMIDGFCKVNRIDDANELLDRMRARGLAPNIFTYNIIIGSLCRRGKVDLAFKLLDKLVAANLQPTVHTYTILLKATIAERGINEAMKLLNEMRERGVEPDTISYNIVLKGLLDVEKWVEMEKVVREMQSRGCEPSLFTHSLLVSVYCREGKAEVGLNMLKSIIKNGLKPDRYGIANFDPVLDALCKNGKVEEALEIFYKLLDVGCHPDLRTYTCLITALWKVGDRSRALKMVEEMLSEGFEPDVIAYNSILSCLCRDRMADGAMRLLKDMESYPIKPNVISYNMVLLCLCKEHRMSDAIELLGQMVENCLPNENTYNILIEGLGFAGGHSEAMGLAGSLVEMGAISMDAYRQLKATMIEGGTNEATKLLDEMFETGHEPNIERAKTDMFNYEPLICARCKEGKLDLAIGVYKLMVSNGCLPNIIIYTVV